jgi:FkbH-like protein
MGCAAWPLLRVNRRQTQAQQENMSTGNGRLAILGNYAMQFIERSIRRQARAQGLPLETYTADYDTTDMELLDTRSGLYAFQPGFILWHESTLAVRDLFYAGGEDGREDFADRYVDRLRGHLARIGAELPGCKVVFPNHAVTFEDNVFGHYGNRLPVSWQYQVGKINHLLNELASGCENLILVHARPEGRFESVTDYSLVVNADLHFTLPYLDWLAEAVIGIVRSQQGRFMKCVVLDLDNTLWGGIIGDDGLEGIQIGALGIGKAFTRLQKWLRELARRGIILAVCSKNDEEVAKEVFLQHEEMVLRLDDISVFVANWESKADNIARIQKILNIGFDSMVFLDDNPAEREIVRQHLPQVVVPELPEDPALYLPHLISLNLFETASHSKTDADRTRQYQEESKRQQLAQAVTNMDEFLESLQMQGEVSSFEDRDVERISQLTLRSNQFNLRTIRYGVPEIRRIMQDPAYETFSVQLADRFGNYGLISLVIVKLQEDGQAVIDTWIMSCRVLKRTVEAMLLNHIVDRLRARGVVSLSGEYIPTEKNRLVKDLLPQLGFTGMGAGTYSLDLMEYRRLPAKIRTGEQDDQ